MLTRLFSGGVVFSLAPLAFSCLYSVSAWAMAWRDGSERTDM